MATVFRPLKGIRILDCTVYWSFEARKLASSDDPDHLSEIFNQDAIMEHMKQIMEYNVLDDLKVKSAEFIDFQDSRI